jgi:hypothetical protein
VIKENIEWGKKLALNEATSEDNANIIGFVLCCLKVAEHKDTLLSCFQHKTKPEIPPTRGVNV